MVVGPGAMTSAMSAPFNCPPVSDTDAYGASTDPSHDKPPSSTVAAW